MKHLSDEIINKYFDSELSANNIKEINEHIKICADCLNKIKAHRLVETNLQVAPKFNISPNFTEMLMSKIQTVSITHKPRTDKIFRVAFAFFSILFLAVLIYAFTGTETNESSKWYELISQNSERILSVIKNITIKMNNSVFASIIVFLILISVYYLYESGKNIKNKFS